MSRSETTRSRNGIPRGEVRGLLVSGALRNEVSLSMGTKGVDLIILFRTIAADLNIKNFVVEVKLRNKDTNIELLDHFDEFPKAVFTRDWSGPFPRENENARTLTEFC